MRPLEAAAQVVNAAAAALNLSCLAFYTALYRSLGNLVGSTSNTVRGLSALPHLVLSSAVHLRAKPIELKTGMH